MGKKGCSKGRPLALTAGKPGLVFPCDLPTWPTVANLLLEIQTVKSADEMVTIMLKIHDLCNISVEAPG